MRPPGTKMELVSAQSFLVLHGAAGHCTALHCSALHCSALHCSALHCSALHCSALHCISCCSVKPCVTAQILYTTLTRFFSTTVSIACDRHKNVPEDQTSAQLLELEKRILEVKDKIRGIVFVSTKTCARTLRERLKATFPSLAVDTVLGQSLGTGMAQPAQRKVINAFKRGELRHI